MWAFAFEYVDWPQNWAFRVILLVRRDEIVRFVVLRVYYVKYLSNNLLVSNIFRKFAHVFLIMAALALLNLCDALSGGFTNF